MAIAHVKTALCLDHQRGHLFAWTPVFLGIGIAVYFALPVEPTDQMVRWGWFALACLCGLVWYAPADMRPLVAAIALIIAGGLLGSFRANIMAAPTLEWRYYGAVEGRVIGIDRSQSDKPRVTLDQVILDRVPTAKTPKKVRLVLHGDLDASVLKPGDTVMTTGHLSPPSGPAEPNGFDFQKFAWFQQLGAVGYTRVPVLKLHQDGAGGWSAKVFALRMAASRAIQDKVPGPNGAVAAALLTGDRSAIPQEALRDLRASNLAHLLAISGLHMGLLAGFVFATMRYGLALFPAMALRWPIKKIAATVALIAAAAYLVISGGTVATQRAFIMVAVMLVAILIGRRALTLRSVAMAALIVLILRPEALIGPRFQMSFAATTALVFVFALIKGVDFGLPSWAKAVLTVVISSGVAGFATAPFAAAHFNQVAHFGLVANLLTVPLMGAVIMPAAVIAVVVWPLGLHGLALWVMAKGIAWVLLIADWIAGIDGALGHVVTPHVSVLPLLSLSALVVILWQGSRRWIGVAGVVCALIIWPFTERPVVLIAESGGLIGVMGPEGRVMNKPKGDGFAASNWLENDGDPVPQSVSFNRNVVEKTAIRIYDLEGLDLLHVTGKDGKNAFDHCHSNTWVVTNKPLGEVAGDCVFLDADKLKQTGSIALFRRADGWHVLTAHDAAGQRIWNARKNKKRPTGVPLSVPNTQQPVNVVLAN